MKGLGPGLDSWNSCVLKSLEFKCQLKPTPVKAHPSLPFVQNFISHHQNKKQKENYFDLLFLGEKKRTPKQNQTRKTKINSLKVTLLTPSVPAGMPMLACIQLSLCRFKNIEFRCLRLQHKNKKLKENTFVWVRLTNALSVD